MTPTALAEIHREAFATPRPWSEAEFAEILTGKDTFLLTQPGGFLIGRIAADEAELLTLAVATSARRQGIGATLLAAFDVEATQRRATRAFLEVAADNSAALALYRKAGWSETGRRRAYYAKATGASVDALLFSKALLAD